MFRILLQSILILAKRTSEEMKENDKTLRQSLEAINMRTGVCGFVCMCLQGGVNTNREGGCNQALF